MDILQLDYSGTLPANYLSEVKNVQLEADRIFGLDGGAFYQNGLAITNVANGQLLAPGVDYKLYELEPELAQLTGGNVAYYLIHVFNRNIGIVSINYHAVGGKYQVNAAFVEALQEKYIGGDGTYPYGNLSQKPVNFSPDFHLQSADTIFDAGALVNSINALADSIANGDPLQNGHLMQHIEDVGAQYEATAVKAFDDLNARLIAAEGRVAYPEGHVIVTDNPENPAVRYGGFWILNPDILLYGSPNDAQLGELVPIATGSGVNARKTYIWSRGEDLGQVTFSLAASATTINEGGSVTFTLTTTGLSAGTQIPYQITGSAGFNGADIAPTALTGRFTINGSGVGTLTVTAVADVLTEGAETFTLALTNVAGQSRTVTINDTSQSPSLNLAFSANPTGTGTITQVNEGQTAYLVLTTANLTYPHTLTLSYTGSTTTSTDFVDPLPTSVVLDGPTEIIDYAIVADRLTEGNETLLVSASSATFTTPQQRSIVVRDTSLSPTYNAYFSANVSGSGSITERNEGQTFYLIIDTTNVDVGTTLNLLYTGSATAADFSGVRPATVTVTGARTVATYTTLNDTVTEGNETMNVVIQLDGTTVATREITIVDTSQNPQFEAFFRTAATGTNYVTQRNEGQQVYFGLRTTGVPAGTTYAIEYSGTATAADFTNALATGITIGSDGEGSILYNIGNDFLTEGAETFTVIVKSGSTVLATATLSIVDTSVNPTYNFRFSASSNGTGTITQANEGSTVYLVCQTTNVPAGSTIALSYPTGAGLTNAADFNTARPFVATVNSSGQAIVTYQLKNDFLTEGDETFRVTATVSSINLITNVDLLIKDTSVPTVSAYFSASSTGNGTISQINEGQTAYLVVNTTGYPNGKYFHFAVGGMLVTDADEWSSSPPIGVTVNWVGTSTVNGQGIATFAIANDFVTDGNKTLTVSILDADNLNAQVGTASVIVNDTSRTPLINSYWSTDPQGSNRLTTTLPAGTVYFIMETQNLPNGSVIDLTWDGGTYPLSNLLNPLLPATVVVNNNRASYAVDLTQATTANIRFQAASGTFPEIGQINEGQSFVLQAQIDGSFSGKTLYLSYPFLNSGGANANAADFTGSLPTQFDVEDNMSAPTGTSTGSVGFTTTADGTLEGNELFTVDVFDDAAKTVLLKRVVITIVDTSIAPEVVIDVVNSQPAIGQGPINLVDLFTAVTGNAPTSSTRVRFVIKAGSTAVGGISPYDFSAEAIAGNYAAIVVGNWPTGSVVTGVTENGANALGRGGTGGFYSDANPGGPVWVVATDGFPCIIKGTNPNHTVTWHNYGLMASGAGGGGMSGRINPANGDLDTRLNAGGGGASYGLGGTINNSIGVGLLAGNGELFEGGLGTAETYGVGVAPAGRGGNPGQNGQDGSIRQIDGSLLVGTDPYTRAGRAGVLLQGDHNNFNLITHPGAVTLGR